MDDVATCMSVCRYVEWLVRSAWCVLYSTVHSIAVVLHCMSEGKQSPSKCVSVSKLVRGKRVSSVAICSLLSFFTSSS